MLSRNRVVELAIEGVVIVVSILLAFGLEAWWDTHGQRQEEAQLLGNLQSEFRAAGAQLDRYLSYHRVTLASASNVLSAARDTRAKGGRSVDVSTIDLARLFIGPTFDPRMGTLEGLLASGRMGVLQNGELRRLLSGWPGLLAEASEEEALSLELTYGQMEPAMRRKMDLSRVRTLPVEMAEAGCAELLFDHPCEGMGLEALSRWDEPSTMPVDLEVLGLLSSRLQVLAHGIDQLGPVRGEIDLIMDQIAMSLGVDPSG